MSGVRRRLKGKKAPKGWLQMEEAIEDFEQQMKEAVNEDHLGKRKCQVTWKVHRIHWEKNRFIYDLMYVRKAISKELFDWLAKEKIADAALIAKWRKPGYEFLCSMLAIQKNGHNFGTTSHCRVPLKSRASAQRVTPDVNTGCVSCASCDSRFGGPIWWNTPLKDEEDEAAEEEHRTQWEQDGEAAAKRSRPEEEDEDELPEDVQARLKALRGE